jgi:hypothetical protein
MAAIGRNDPCPCGSGKKHKRCCALVTDVGAQAARLHDLDRTILAKLMPLLQREGFDVWRSIDDLAEELGDEPDMLAPILAPFVIYEQPAGFLLDEPDESLGTDAPAAILLARYPARFDARERAWIMNQANVKTRLWEVTGVERGVSLDLVNVESKDERRVMERLGSTSIPLRSGVLGRVVDFEGISVFDGMYPRAIGPRGIEGFLRFVKELSKNARKRLAKDTSRLASVEAIHRLVAFAKMVELEDEARARPPTINNTDGELFVPTNDRFTFAPARRQEVLSAIAALEHCDRDDDPDAPEDHVAHYNLWKDGNRLNAHWDNTILGHIEVRTDVVVLRTNSIERADAHATMLAAALDGIAERGLRDHEDVLQALNRAGPPAPAPVPSAAAREALRELIRAHEEAWPDSPIPALGGKTPRQAMKTKKGRAEVELILREMEHFASHAGEGGMDPKRVRAALGL